MQAKYKGTCGYCSGAIEVGDEITRGNGSRSGPCRAFFAHASCVPAAGRLSRAQFVAVVIEADERGWIPIGTRKQYVRRAMAEATAQSWRDCGAKQVEVQELF